MSENKTKTKSIPEIMEMLDYSLGKTRILKEIAKSIIVLGEINEPHARKTLAKALSEQVDGAEWSTTLAREYVDDLEAALDKEIHTIDEDTTEDDLPFVTPGEEVEA